MPEQREGGLVEEHVLAPGRHVGIEADIATDRAARDELGCGQVIARAQETAVSDRASQVLQREVQGVDVQGVLGAVVIVMVEQATQ